MKKYACKCGWVGGGLNTEKLQEVWDDFLVKLKDLLAYLKLQKDLFQIELFKFSNKMHRIIGKY